ncbi:MAG: hypothetical protein Q8878_03950 [Bacillota bacterium]|nr:hypothetical protein [Bacillota bacterium]
MKKLALFLVLTLVFCTFVGCSGKSAPAGTSTAAQSAPAASGSVTQQSSAPAGAAGDFDDYKRPQVVPAGTKFKLGAITKDLSSESINRADHQLKVECAHRGWDYVPVYYDNEANYNDAFNSLLSQGVQSIVLINPMAVDTHLDLYENARNQGVGVYSIIGSVNKGIITDIGIPGSVATMELLYRIGNDYNWKLNIAVLRCDSQLASSERMFPVIGYLQGNFRPNMKLVVTDEISSLLNSLGSSMMAGQQMARTWLQKYGDQIGCIFSYGDNGAMGAAEVIKSNGDIHGDKCFTVGIDGGKQSWSYIRNDAPLKYSYAQPIELFAHQMAELVKEVQIDGLNPGDKGCILDKSGHALYYNGNIITKANVPDIGTSIHQAFSYYDASKTGEDAWWNWKDGPGIYLVEAYQPK